MPTWKMLPVTERVRPRPLMTLYGRWARGEVLIASDREKADAIAYLRDWPEGAQEMDPLYRLAEMIVANAPENF